MSSAICFHFDQSEIFSSSKGLKAKLLAKFNNAGILIHLEFSHTIKN